MEFQRILNDEHEFTVPARSVTGAKSLDGPERQRMKTGA
jgi:hypothetical protein